VAEAQALPTLDLTTSAATGQINGAWFYQADAASTGSGVIASFVRIQTNDPIEHGYNTDYRPLQYDENNSPIFTRSLLLSNVPIVNLGGTLYREFLLDINQEATGAGRLLSLDTVEVYQADAENLHNHPTGLGTLIYDMDGLADSWILLDYGLESGSGSGDMFAYIPDSSFDDEEDYVYLYSMFGASEDSAYPNTASFEEWAVVRVGDDPPPPPQVPVPGALLLAGLGAGGVACLRRRRAL